MLIRLNWWPATTLWYIIELRKHKWILNFMKMNTFVPVSVPFIDIGFSLRGVLKSNLLILLNCIKLTLIYNVLVPSYQRKGENGNQNCLNMFLNLYLCQLFFISEYMYIFAKFLFCMLLAQYFLMLFLYMKNKIWVKNIILIFYGYHSLWKLTAYFVEDPTIALNSLTKMATHLLQQKKMGPY